VPFRTSRTDNEPPSRVESSVTIISMSPLTFASVLIPPPSGVTNVKRISCPASLLEEQNASDSPSQSPEGWTSILGNGCILVVSP